MKKSRAVFGLILNLLILGVLGFAFANGYFKFLGDTQWIKDLSFFNYFTHDSNILLGVAAIISLIACIAALAGKKVAKFVAAWKLIAVTATTVTMITALAYLAPQQGWWIVTDWTYNMHLHIIAPVLGIISIIVENKPRLKWTYAFLGIIPVAAYGAAMIPLVNYNNVPDPYGFLAFNAEWWITVLWIAGFVVGSFFLALIFILLHNIGSAEAEEAVAPAQKEEAKAEEQPKADEQAKPEEKPEEKAAEEAKPEEKEPKEEQKEAGSADETQKKQAAPARPSNARRAYHITKQPSGKWQVKLANGEKAIKLFDTQAEAIAFAKGLVESRGGSYRIHSVKGKIRK